MPTTIRRGLLALAATVFFCAQMRSGHALTIVPEYTSNVTSLPNFSSGMYNIQSAVNYAINQIDSHFSNPITLFIQIDSVAGQSVLGESSNEPFYIIGNGGYSDFRNAYINAATTPNQHTAANSLGVADPTSGNGTFFLTEAETEALGFNIGTDALNNSGTFTFGAGYTYAFDPANRAVAGEIDFIGMAEHEMTEIMGRIPGLGEPGTVNSNPVNVYMPFDLFRYTANGVRTLVPNTPSTPPNNAYFSIDGGLHNLHYFNSINGEDPQDWQVASQPLDAFNASVNFGQEIDMSPVDFTTMDVLGYDLTPEPSSWVLLAFGAVGVLILGRRVRRAAAV